MHQTGQGLTLNLMYKVLEMYHFCYIHFIIKYIHACGTTMHIQVTEEQYTYNRFILLNLKYCSIGGSSVNIQVNKFDYG